MSYQFKHRQLADEMEIFFFDEEIGAGLPVWLPASQGSLLYALMM